MATPPLNSEELIELEQLRVKYEQLKKQVATGPAKVEAAKKKKPQLSDSGSSSDSEVSASLNLQHICLHWIESEGPLVRHKADSAITSLLTCFAVE